MSCTQPASNHIISRILSQLPKQRQLENTYKILVINQLNPLNAELNPICHLLALLGAHLILHVSRIRVNAQNLVL